MSDHTCDRCRKGFDNISATYNAYLGASYSYILREENVGQYEPHRLVFVQSDFSKVTSPFLGVKDILYLCPKCRIELGALLEGFFNND